MHPQTSPIILLFKVPRETAACAHSVVPTEMKVGDCVSPAKVNMTQCVGTCGSNATTVFMEPFVETNCKCCKPTSMTKQTVNLQCGKLISRKNLIAPKISTRSMQIFIIQPTEVSLNSILSDQTDGQFFLTNYKYHRFSEVTNEFADLKGGEGVCRLRCEAQTPSPPPLKVCNSFVTEEGLWYLVYYVTWLDFWYFDQFFFSSKLHGVTYQIKGCDEYFTNILLLLKNIKFRQINIYWSFQQILFKITTSWNKYFFHFYNILKYTFV